MPIDLSTVNWEYVAILSLLAFIAALLGSIIAFRNRFVGAILAGILFAIGFVFWTYYPHANIPGPISPGDVGPAQASPAQTSPVQTSPAPTNPVQTLPAPTSPAQTSPAPSTPK